jgi:hypothetical protein
MDYYKISIAGKQFEKHYLIYIIQLRHQSKKTYYYVGQTGDRNYKTARPAFRRLAGHLEDQGYSTQNQLYKAIVEQILKKNPGAKKSFSNELKAEVSSYLVQSDIDMYVFPVLQFDECVDYGLHRQNVVYVENVEKFLIQKMIDRLGADKILNKKKDRPASIDNAEAVAEEILNMVINVV